MLQKNDYFWGLSEPQIPKSLGDTITLINQTGVISVATGIVCSELSYSDS